MADLPLLWVSMSWKVFSFMVASSPWTPTGSVRWTSLGLRLHTPVIDSHYTLAISSAVPLLISFRRLCFRFLFKHIIVRACNISRAVGIKKTSNSKRHRRGHSRCQATAKRTRNSAIAEGTRDTHCVIWNFVKLMHSCTRKITFGKACSTWMTLKIT